MIQSNKDFHARKVAEVANLIEERRQVTVLSMNAPTHSEISERSPETTGRVFNVASNSSDLIEKRLSNLDHAPFVMDGKAYASIEGFWQGLKYPEGSVERERIAGLSGIGSKKAGNGAPPSETFVYLGETYSVGSPEHQLLMKRAIRAKLEQNPDVLELILSTGDATIIHDPKYRDGTSYPDSTTVPATVFSRFLMELREEFRNGSVPGKSDAFARKALCSMETKV